MGCTPGQGNDGCPDTAGPPQSVRLDDFHIGKYQVTRFEWNLVMGIQSYHEENNLPMDNVSWDRVQEFIEKLNELTRRNYRLPTEAEWEYAARGGSQSNGSIYSGGDNLDDVGWYVGNSGHRRTRPVGMKAPNELGLHDMSGNVDEWVGDWYDSYRGGSHTNPTGPASGTHRVVRGGSVLRDASASSVFSRGGWHPNVRDNHSLGFRLAITSTR